MGDDTQPFSVEKGWLGRVLPGAQGTAAHLVEEFSLGILTNPRGLCLLPRAGNHRVIIPDILRGSAALFSSLNIRSRRLRQGLTEHPASSF